MALSINSNSLARRIALQLGRSSNALATSFERLSSGTRLNHASDDPAGLAVSLSIKTKGIIKNRASLNVGDSISALNIASGTLDSVTTLLTRMQELATQASNGSYSSSQRTALDREFSQLGLELRRITETTKFNGQSLLKGQKAGRSAEQLTTNAVSAFVSSGDGRYLTYRNSTSNSLEQLDTTTGVVTQIASATSGTSISTSNNGDAVFVSSSNINGLNAALRSQVYYYNKSTGSISLVTNSGAGESLSATISADGGTIAFSSRKLYDASGGSAGTAVDTAIHTYSTASGIYSRTADSDFQVTRLKLSSDGSYLAISGQQTGGFPPADSDNMLLARTATLSSSLRNIGTQEIGQGTDYDYSILNDGRVIYISDTAQGGLATLGVNQIYQYSYASATYSRLTSQTDSGVEHLAVKNDGSAFTFTSRSNQYGDNPNSKYQAFRYDFAGGAVQQLTNYGDATLFQNGQISADGNSLFYIGTGSKLTKVDISAASFELNVETGTGTVGIIQALLGAVDGILKGLGTHLLTTQSSARAALDFAKLNIERQGVLQGLIGASMSRLESAGRLLSAERGVLSAANGAISDADIASESANLVRTQILQNAGTALLAQAKLQPQIALSLLQGVAA